MTDKENEKKTVVHSLKKILQEKKFDKSESYQCIHYENVHL